MVASLALPIVISGCASFPGTTFYLDELKSASPSGAAFTQALSREYYAFAQSEKDQYDWMNSWHFAKKGLDASHGTVVAPEDLSDWSFDDKQAAADLTASRARLVKALESNAPSRLPALTATAQVKFDCWVEQQDEGWQKDDIAACRNDFLAAMTAIEASAKAPVAAVKPAAAERFQLFFDFNKSKLTAEAARTVQEVAKVAKAAGYPKLALVGYTDLAGKADFNMRLSLKRAEAVRKALIAAGVPADRLSAEGRGKTDPQVSTKDGVREPQNRRVVVRFPG
jgi:OOP family OmpA-OmpF porin